MTNFRTIDRQTGFLLPPSVGKWLPGRHVARFVVEVIEALDPRAMVCAYRGADGRAANGNNRPRRYEDPRQRQPPQRPGL